MTDMFQVFDKAIALTTEPFTNLADTTLTGLDDIEKRNQDRKAQIEKERAEYKVQIQQSLGN